MNSHERAQDGQQPAPAPSPPSVDARAVLGGHRPIPSRRPIPYVDGGFPDTRWEEIPNGRCSACGQPWQGDAETGGCDAVVLAKRVIELETALLAIIDHEGMLCCVHVGPCPSSGNAIGIAEAALSAPAGGAGEG